MSLARLALRLATARALRGATLAADRVFDSAIDPIDHRISQDAKPVIVIYTDDHEENAEGRALGIGGNSSCDLVIEFAMVGSLTIDIPEQDGNAATTLAVAETDETIEFMLDLIERQIISALTTGRGPWPDLWRVFCFRILRRMSRRGSSAESASRFAARQLTLTCDLLIDPEPGLPPAGAWADLLAAVAADPKMAPIGPLLRSMITGGDADEFEQFAGSLGVNLDVGALLGGGPIIVGDAPVALQTGGIAGDAGGQVEGDKDLKIYMATAATGANLIDLTVPGLTLGGAVALVWFLPAAPPGFGGVLIGINGGPALPLVGGFGEPIAEGAWPAGYPILIAISAAGAQVFQGP